MAATSLAMKAARLTSLTQMRGSTHPDVQSALSGLAGRQARRRCFVLSLSAVGDDDVMWSFYADEHRGICLELDGKNACFADIFCGSCQTRTGRSLFSRRCVRPKIKAPVSLLRVPRTTRA
jgi:hypothetical protein